MDCGSEIEVISWSGEAAEILDRASEFHDPADPGRDVLFYRALVYANRAHMLGTRDNGELVAVLVYSIEPGLEGLELVVLTCAAVDPKYDIIANHLGTLEYLARAMGAKTVRFHTSRKGLGRVMEGRGYRLSEYVYRKPIMTELQGDTWRCDVQEGITMGGGGGGSSESTTNQTDERIAAENSVVADDGATINIDVQDIGPELAKELRLYAADVFDYLETESEAIRGQQNELIQRTFDNAPAGVQDLLRDMIKMGAGVAVAYAALRWGPGVLKEAKGLIK